eukprot:TRINITY_DN1349_c1_g3_i2.p1 TRINITY_DN1349_c1_g3~~TRINITY_DN1349_c1_g3_i2.p1  ORF type:complete len:442 (+),score=47.88 TRINITY_DN1349_c1_g3_i2:149-1474(+)
METKQDVANLWISRTDLKRSGDDRQFDVPRIVRYLRHTGGEKQYGAGLITDITDSDDDVSVCLQTDADTKKVAKLNSISTRMLKESEVSDALVSLIKDITRVSWCLNGNTYSLRSDISSWKVYVTQNGIQLRELLSPSLRSVDGEIVIEARGAIVPICKKSRELDPRNQETITRIRNILRMAQRGSQLPIPHDSKNVITSSDQGVSINSAKTTPYSSLSGSKGHPRRIQTPGNVSPKMHPVAPPQLAGMTQPVPNQKSSRRPSNNPVLLADVVSPRGPPLASPPARSLNTERDALDTQLKRYGFIEHPVKADGNCLFRSLAWHLYGDDSRHKEVRSQVVNHLSTNSEKYSPFVDEDYRSYLKEMSRQDTWGDHVTLQAAADSYGLLFHVITSSEKSKCHQIRPRVAATRDQEPLWLSFCATPHAEHYNPVTRPKNKHHGSS